jgi:hypothetical protein
MWHATYTQGNWGDSRLLVVGNQIINLTFDPSFKCPNGSCEPILNIYVPRAFQWYKEFLNPMGFDSYNRILNIQESIGIPTPKMEAHLGGWRFIPSHFPTLLGAWDVTLELLSWPTPLQTLVQVASPRLGLRQEVNLTWSLLIYTCFNASPHIYSWSIFFNWVKKFNNVTNF